MAGRFGPHDHDKIKVLVISNGLSTLGGIERFLLELIREKSLAQKVDFRVLSPNTCGSRTAGGLLSNYKQGIRAKITELDKVVIGGLTFPKIGMVPKILDEYNRADVIYFTDLSSAFSISLTALLLGHRKKATFVFENPYMAEMFCHGRGLGYRIFNAIRLKLIFSAFSNFQVLNKDDLRKVRKIKSNSAVYYIPNLADSIFETRKGSRARNSKFTAIFVGRLASYHKGVDLLEQIIAKVYNRADKKKIRFRIVGPEGDGIDAVRRLCSDRRYDVEYLGSIDSTQRLAKEYNSADLFVFPSRFEGFSIALLEAMLSGLPAVAFDIQGSRDIIINNKTGKLVRAYDVDGFADGVIYYLHRWGLDQIDKGHIAESTRDRFGRSRSFESIYKMFASIKNRS